MSKNKKKLKSKQHKKINPKVVLKDKLDLPEYVYWLITGAIFLFYFIFSTLSEGFYTHDEVSHFLNMQDFWMDWRKVLGIWAKPGFKFAYILPSLFGATAVVMTNCLYTALTAYVTGLAAKEYKINDRILVMVLVAFIPMLYQIAFRNYAEMITALVLAGTIYFYKKERYILAALLASYLFPLRQEMALVGVFMGALFLVRRQFLPILALATAPILLNLVGWAGTGDPLFLLTSLSGGTGDYRELGFFHLWRVFLPAMGIVITPLFLLGILGFVIHKDGWGAYFKKYEILYIAFLPVFLFSCLVTEPLFTYIKLGANWKQLVQLAPPVAIFAGLGFQVIRNQQKQQQLIYGLVIFSFLALVTFSSLSYEHNYVFYSSVPEYSKITLLLVTMLICFGLPRLKVAYKHIGLILSVIAVCYTVYTEPPIPLSPEDVTMKEMANFIVTNNLETRPKIVNTHPIFHYYIGNTSAERQTKYTSFPKLNEFEILPKGAIIVWESHYSKRRSDVDITYFQNNPKYKLLHQKMAPNKRFYAAIFEKL